jgi:type II secretory ATPase GspE/PulE/Tfp pilus assembly ATPase PilB-like protein
VLAQRLARKLCANCCEMYMPSVDELLAAHITPEIAAQWLPVIHSIAEAGE